MAAAVTMFLTQQLELARRCRNHNCLQQPKASETTKHIARHSSPHVSILGEGEICSFKSQYEQQDNRVRFPLFSTLFVGVSLDLLAPSNSVLEIIPKNKICWVLRWIQASLMQNTAVNFDAQCLKFNPHKAVEAIYSGGWPKCIWKVVISLRVV